MEPLKPVSERGYFYDLSLSPYTFVGTDIKTEYKFPSPKKKEVYVNEVNKRVSYLFYLTDRIYSISKLEIPMINEIIIAIEKDVYEEMRVKF